jgi:ferredoxin
VNIEHNFPDRLARKQGARCLRCNINTVFDPSICIACNGCVDICPQHIIKLVGLRRLETDNGWRRQLCAEWGVAPEALTAMSPDELDAMGAVMLKDETTCIRCAMCASRCPTHAITMQRFEFFRKCVTVPAPNPRIKYATGP